MHKNNILTDMVSEKLKKIWERSGNLSKLAEHGFITPENPPIEKEQSETPTPIVRYRKKKRKRTKSKPITIRLSRDNYEYLQGKSRTAVINSALDQIRMNKIEKEDTLNELRKYLYK